MLPRGAFDVFDDLLAVAFACSRCLSHVPLLSGYDEAKTLSYQFTLFGPKGADVRHVKHAGHHKFIGLVLIDESVKLLLVHLRRTSLRLVFQ